MSREILLNALDQNVVAFLSQGVWRHPRDRSTEFNTMRYWLDYARLLEDGRFDALFQADTIGVYDIFGGNKDTAVERAVQVPENDPMMVVPAMAAVTEHLCFGTTGNLLYEPPYLFARRMSTLDHLTGGRVAWNVVTGILHSGARAHGRDAMLPHDERYDVAEEYMEIMYGLWEGSWEDGAVLADRASGRYADPAKVHEISHDGRYFKLRGTHLSQPSPQRTPVIFQAGASARGAAFAAKHSECIFINGPSPAVLTEKIAATRKQAAAMGRDPHDIRFFAGLCVVVGKTEAEAQAKYEEYRRYATADAVLAHVSASLGIDLKKYPLDEPIRYEENDSNRTAMEALTRRKDRVWTVRQVAEEMAVSARNLLLVGSPEQVADGMIRWVEDGGIDGFNLARLVMPGSFEDFIELVVPVLQRRGYYKRAYRPGTMRQKIGGAGPRVPATHPAAGYRAGHA
jgi:FMN-dependent oxidoreductase (nitrilotriacetate monooxygenase family)